jgi:hypothetical protein
MIERLVAGSKKVSSISAASQESKNSFADETVQADFRKLKSSEETSQDSGDETTTRDSSIKVSERPLWKAGLPRVEQSDRGS